MKYEPRSKSFLKSVSWRIIGIIWLWFIAWAFTQSLVQTSLTTIIHHTIFIVVFYLHERVWQKIKVNEKYKPYIKSFTYEIILGNLILGLITFSVTGSIQKMTGITLTYILSKIPMYWIHERLWRRKKIVYAYVVGDILHIGHLKHLKRAKKYGDYLIVGVLTNKATMEKKPEPTISLYERMAMIEELKCVDEVLLQFTYSPLPNVEVLMPDVLMENPKHKEQPANDFVLSYGGKVIQSPYYEGQSSTLIKNKIIENEKI